MNAIHPNELRGAIDLTLNGKTYKLKPSASAMVAFEDKAGCGVYQAMDELQKGRPTAKIIVSAIWSGIHGCPEVNGRRLPSWESVCEMVQRAGIMSLLVPVHEYLGLSLASDEQIKSYQAKAESGEGEPGNGATAETPPS